MLDEIKMEVLSSINRTVEDLQKKLKEVEKKQAELLNHKKLQARQIKCEIAKALITSDADGQFNGDIFDFVMEKIFGEKNA
jgi:hypothetical protein